MLLSVYVICYSRVIMRIGYIGLGRMGKNMVLRLLEQGIEVVAWNRSPQRAEELRSQNSHQRRGSPEAAKVKIAESLKNLVDSLDKPRIIWIMLPEGVVVDTILDQLVQLVGPGDLLIDGGNSYYKDTLKRAKSLEKKGIQLMDIGVSGGPDGARSGACLMIGGSKKDYTRVLPLVKAAAAPQAYGHFGKVGAGHFAKMVHNGIEYGMMEAIAEGAAVLKSSGLIEDIAEVFRVYNNRSVIESRLVGWTQEALAEDPDLGDISSMIGHTGEGEWTIKTAKEGDVEVPVIEDSFKVRVESEKVSEDSPEGYRNKVVSAMRGKFGQHAVKKT